MAFSYMQRTVADFFAAIDGINQSLANCSVSVEEHRSRVLKALDDFRKDVSDVSQTYLTANKDRNSGVHNALVETIAQLKTVLENWDESIRRSVSAQEFMHKNEKYLVAMVFGQVKTGKSSLGNFIGGQAFKSAAFDNEYKKRQHPEFIVEKSGRNGNIINDSNNETWFTEGVVDTTGAGDSFYAGVCAGLTYGKSLKEACEIGTKLAASVIQSIENVCPRFLPSEFNLKNK